MKLLDYPSLLKSFVAELGKELAMRRIVWRVIAGTSHLFGSSEKQNRYDSMRLMEKVFKEMNPRELQTIVERIVRKKEAAKSSSNLFNSAIVILLLLFSSCSLSGQEQVDTVSNGILKLKVINDHLKFYKKDVEFNIMIAYKENQEAKFQFKEKIKKKGSFLMLVQKNGIYKINVYDSKTPCVFVMILDIQESTTSKSSFLQCTEPIYPENEKKARTNKKPSRI